jgi:hypothetical protein
MKRTAIVLFLLLLAAPLLASGCGGDEGLPEGFPEDFPLWDRATIAAATEVPDGGQAREYLLGMESTESSTAARSFYESALGEEPWQVDNVVEIPASDVAPASPEASPEPPAPVETTVIVFSRSDGSQTGTLAIQEQQTNGRKTTIAVSLTILR